jgi:putative addiction module component (TIGR02574 family)
MLTLGIDKLSDADRIRLVEEILDSLTDQRELGPITASQRQELDRRLEGLEKGNTKFSPWDEVREL